MVTTSGIVVVCKPETDESQLNNQPHANLQIDESRLLIQGTQCSSNKDIPQVCRSFLGPTNWNMVKVYVKRNE
jgi:hypothetical protein